MNETKSELMLKVGQRLTKMRKNHKMRQSEVAALLDITTGAYQNYEYGKRECGYTALVTLADYYNVSVDYLLCRTDEMQPDAHIAALDPFSKNEKMILSAYLNIDDRSKTALISIIKEISDRYAEQKLKSEYLSDKEKGSKFA